MEDLLKEASTESLERVKELANFNAETAKEAAHLATEMSTIAEKMARVQLDQKKQEHVEAESIRKHELDMQKLADEKLQRETVNEIEKAKLELEKQKTQMDFEYKQAELRNRELLARIEVETRLSVSKNETAGSIIATFGNVFASVLTLRGLKFRTRTDVSVIKAFMDYCKNPDNPYLDNTILNIVKSKFK